MLFREVAPHLEKLFGPEHARTLVSKGLLAATLMDQGKNAESESLFREVLPHMEKVFGFDGRTLVAKSDFAATLRAQGKIDEAESLFRVVIPHMEKVLFEEHSRCVRHL